jgi:hypothetical protein
MKHCSEERERLARRREQQELEQAREQLATRFVGNSTWRWEDPWSSGQGLSHTGVLSHKHILQLHFV